MGPWKIKHGFQIEGQSVEITGLVDSLSAGDSQALATTNAVKTVTDNLSSDLTSVNDTLTGFIPLSGSDQISGNLIPAVTGLSLGTSANPWSDVFAGSGTVHVGDKRINSQDNQLFINNYPIVMTEQSATPSDSDKIIKVNVETFGDVGDGRDGDLVVSTNITVNEYAGLSGDYTSSDNVITIDSSSSMPTSAVADNLIMIIQMQTYRDGVVGQYQINEVESVDGNNITLKNNLNGDYYSDNDGAKQNNTKTQIVTIPQYNSISIQTGTNITCDVWDGYKGGIVIFKCFGTISGNGGIDANGQGYQVGNRRAGEGYQGWGGTGYLADVDNFGGGGSAHGPSNAGCAGGGHAEAGDDMYSGTQWAIGGRAFGSSNLLTNLTFGGAAGNINSGSSEGGGIIAVWASSCTIAGTINVRGTFSGFVPSYSRGAAGSILLVGFDASGLTTDYSGGDGGSVGYYLNSVSPAPIIKYTFTNQLSAESPPVTGYTDADLDIMSGDIIQNSTDIQTVSSTLDDTTNNLSGYVTLDSDQTITSNKTINGNVRVNGTFTATSSVIIHTENIALSANYITLNDNLTGDPTENAGISVNRGTSANSELTWNETTDKWQAGISGDLDDIVLNTDLQIVSGIVDQNTTDVQTVSTQVDANTVSITGNDIDIATLGGVSGDISTNASSIQTTSAQSDSVFSTVSTNSASWEESADIESLSAVITGNTSDIATLGGVSGNIAINASDIQTVSSQVDINTNNLTGFIPLSGSDQINGNLVPSLTGLTLGTSANPWQEGFFSSGSVYLGSDQLHTLSGYLKVNDDTLVPVPIPTVNDDEKYIAASVTYRSDTGDGSDGDVVISSADTVINSYAGLTNDALAGATSILTDGLTGFTEGQQIVILQCQNYRDGELGAFEFATISSIDGSTINLNAGLLNSYYSDTLTVLQQATRSQVITVKQYNNLTINTAASITCDAWDGDKGGVVLFKVNGTLAGDGDIVATAKGYRGGNGSVVSRGSAGEGYRGFGPQGTENYGGGSSNDSQTANGGGGHKTTSEGLPWVAGGGRAFGSADLKTYLTFGGAGGYTRDYGNGGHGGGIIAAYVKVSTHTGDWLAVGGPGSNFRPNTGGAGGAILIAEFESGTISYNVAGDPEGGGEGFYLNDASEDPPIVVYNLYNLSIPISAHTDADINAMSADIIQNTTDIQTVSSQVDTNTESITGNDADISALGGVSGNIANNASDISTLGGVSGNIANNTSDIQTVSSELSNFIPLSGSDQINGNLIPSTSGLTLGTSANPWEEIYVTSGSIHLGNYTLTESTLESNDSALVSVTGDVDTLNTDVDTLNDSVAEIKSGWVLGSSPTRTSDSTFTVTDNATNQAIYKQGRPIRFSDSLTSSYRYGYVHEYDTGTVTFYGTPMTTSYDSYVWYGDFSRAQQLEFFVPGVYGDSTTTTMLMDKLNYQFIWGLERAYLVRMWATHHVVDSTSEPTINIKLRDFAYDGTLSGIALGDADSLQQMTSETNVDPAHPFVVLEDPIEISCSTAGGTGDAEDLVVRCVFVLE